jgi:hypothetical protein
MDLVCPNPGATRPQNQSSGGKRRRNRPKDPKEILIVDRGGSRRIVDLVEGVKVPKQEQNR